jgi:hypothetical protein
LCGIGRLWKKNKVLNKSMIGFKLLCDYAETKIGEKTMKRQKIEKQFFDVLKLCSSWTLSTWKFFSTQRDRRTGS